MTTEQFQTAEHLQIAIALLDKRLIERDEKITILEEQLAWFQRQIFGKKSERIASNLGSEQLDFEGFDVPQAIRTGQNHPRTHQTKA